MSTSKDISGHKMCPLGIKLVSSIRKFHFSSSACVLETYVRTDSTIYIRLARKMVPITGRASSFLEKILLVCTLIKRKRRRRQNENYRAINLPIVI